MFRWRTRSVGGVHRRRIYLIPCRANCFVLDDFEEKDEFILLFQIVLVQFNLLFRIVLCKAVSAAKSGMNSFPPTEVTSFALSSVQILLLWKCDTRFNNMWTQYCTNLRCWIGGDVGGVTFFVVRMMAGLHLISFYHLRYLHLSQAPEKLQSKYKNNFV